jgi:hypothetical protein
MSSHQVLSLDTLPEFHLKPCGLLHVDVKRLHDGSVQVVGVIRQQVGVRVVADVSVA